MFDAGSVIAKVKADLSDFQKGMEQVKTKAQSMADGVKGGITSMNNTIKDMTPQLQKAALGVGAVGAAGTLLLKDWAGAAMGAEVQMAQFNATIQAMGNVSEETKNKLLEAGAAATQMGFDDEDATVSMGKFYQRTKDVEESQKLLAVAMDLARAKGIDLSSATDLVGQVLAGNGKVLKQYGIDIKDSATPLEALGELSTKVAGQAQAFTDTTSGGLAKLSVDFGNFKEQLGAALLPILNQVIAVGEQVITWLQNLSPEAIKIIAIVTLCVTVFAALLAPLLIFITLIPAIVAGFGFIVAAITLVFSPIGIVIALFIALGVLIATNLQQFKDFFTLIALYAQQFFDAARATFDAGIKYINDAWTGMMNVISGITTSVLEGIKNYFRDGINYILGLIQGVLDTYNSIVTKVGLGRIAAPKIPKLAEGGIVSKPTLAMIGEGGEPEAVVPLSKLNGMGGGGVHIHLHDSFITSVDAATEMFDAAIRRVQPRLGV